MDDLTETMESARLEDGPQEPEYLLFEPKEDSGLPQEALNRIPRYLFRVVSPRSDGITSEKWVRSKAVKENGRSPPKDIFFNLDSSKKVTVARTLNLHLRWWPKKKLRDNFVSWTSSLLFAIQYIYYRHLHDEDGSSLEEIKLYTIDTTLFPRGTFLRDLDLIDAFRDFDDHDSGCDLVAMQILRNRPNFYFGEYLSQGSLRIANKCQVIPAESLFENDRLQRLQPHFTNLQNNAPSHAKIEWTKEVVRLRRIIWPERGFRTHLQLLSSAEMSDRLQVVKKIVHDAASGWRYPLAIHFAALMGAESVTKDQGMAYDNVFFENFRSESFDGPEGRPSSFRVIASDTMPELKHIEKLVLEVHKHCNLKRALDHVQAAERSLRKLRVQAVNSKDKHALTADDPNENLARAGQELLSKLRTVQQLCQEIAVTISPGEA